MFYKECFVHYNVLTILFFTVNGSDGLKEDIMVRFLCWLVISTGLLLIGYGGAQHYFTEDKQEKSFIKAQEIIGSPSHSTNRKVKNFKPQEGDVIGILSIPTLNAELPIIEGTNPVELEKGVGHYSSSSLPDQKDQILLSGHRDTVFRNLGDVRKNEELILKLPYGNYTYKIFDFKIVDANDLTVIKSTYPDEILVLTTCYPFSYVGNAPERYVIYAQRNYDAPL
jgi:sortase A